MAERELNPLCQVLHDPAVVRGWEAAQWNRFLPLVRSGRLQGRCLALFRQQGLEAVVPQRVMDQLQGALAQTRYVQVQALRELRNVQRILELEGIPLMALKGVAYLVAELPPAAWRNLSDIDLLVPLADIGRAEASLKRAGWTPNGEFDAYDEHYYRAWMHEVPPLSHPARGVEVDMHHNLSPLVSRIKIDAELLWQQAVSVDAALGGTLAVLSPEDMLIHNAVHLFMNDELRGGLRDVVDFCDLFTHFRLTEPDFEARLLSRAGLLGCGRPLFYALDTAQRLAGLRASEPFFLGVRKYAPGGLLLAVMRWLIDQALAPQTLGLRRTAVAKQLLFVRSHWVRMPAPMLFRHLIHKALRSKKPVMHDAELPG